MKEVLGRINIGVAILSLGISLLIFYTALPTWMSKGRHQFRVELSVDQHLFNKNNFVIVKDPKYVTVHAVMTDQEATYWLPYITAEADLSDAHAGSGLYPVTINPPKFRNMLEEAVPEAPYTLELVKHTTVPVTVTSSGKLSDPEEILDSTKVDIKGVQIDGPASDVEKVVGARATLALEKLVPQSTKPVQVTVDPIDADGRVVDNVSVHPDVVFVTPQFSLAPQQKQVFVTPVFMDGQPPAGFVVKDYSPEPNLVTASGSSQSLAKIARVTTEPIDVTKMTSTQIVTIRLQSAAPDVVFHPDTVRVRIVIEPAPAKKDPSTPPLGNLGNAGATGHHR